MLQHAQPKCLRSPLLRSRPVPCDSACMADLSVDAQTGDVAEQLVELRRAQSLVLQHMETLLAVQTATQSGVEALQRAWLSHDAPVVRLRGWHEDLRQAATLSAEELPPAPTEPPAARPLSARHTSTRSAPPTMTKTKTKTKMKKPLPLKHGEEECKGSPRDEMEPSCEIVTQLHKVQSEREPSSGSFNHVLSMSESEDTSHLAAPLAQRIFEVELPDPVGLHLMSTVDYHRRITAVFQFSDSVLQITASPLSNLRRCGYGLWSRCICRHLGAGGLRSLWSPLVTPSLFRPGKRVAEEGLCGVGKPIATAWRLVFRAWWGSVRAVASGVVLCDVCATCGCEAQHS